MYVCVREFYLSNHIFYIKEVKNMNENTIVIREMLEKDVYALISS